jgi:hypothetical protein
MSRHCGRVPNGDRLRTAIPLGHRKTAAFIVGLGLGGFAPFVFDGPINAVSFEADVEQLLVPRLKPNDAVVMDNRPAADGPRSRP